MGAVAATAMQLETNDGEQKAPNAQQYQRSAWVCRWPGQAVLAASHIFWTAAVESAFSAGAAGVKALYGALLRQLSELSAMVRGERGALSPLARLTLSALIVMDIHQRDVVKTSFQASTPASTSRPGRTSVGSTFAR